MNKTPGETDTHTHTKQRKKKSNLITMKNHQIIKMNNTIDGKGTKMYKTNREQ
jgi:hypothetical protein